MTTSDAKSKWIVAALVLAAVLLLAIAIYWVQNIRSPQSASPPPRPITPSAYPPGKCTGYVALTFDDGPTAGTRAIADELSQWRSSAVFFIRGDQAARDPETVRYLAARGNQIGNHSEEHVSLTDLPTERVEAEIAATQTILTKITGQAPKLVRAPFSEDDAQTLAIYKKFSLDPVYGSVDSRNWEDISVDEVIQNVLSKATAGDIVIMQDSPDERTLTALPYILDGLHRKGLCTGKIVPSAYNPQVRSSVTVVPSAQR